MILTSKHTGFSTLYRGNHSYGFQGQESDNEVKGEGNSVNFSARIMDPRVGRWLSRDPMEKSYSDYSPYSLLLNSPIRYIDVEGNFVVDPETAKKYPRFTNYIKNLSKEYSEKPETFRQAFKEYSDLSDDEIKSMLTFGQGPLIKVENLDRDSDGDGVLDNFINGSTFGYIDKKTNIVSNANNGEGLISIDDDVANKMENASNEKEYQKGKMLVESTVFHEGTHFGDNKDGKQEMYETGKEFEKTVYRSDVGRSNFNQVYENLNTVEMYPDEKEVHFETPQ